MDDDGLEDVADVGDGAAEGPSSAMVSCRGFIARDRQRGRTTAVIARMTIKDVNFQCLRRRWRQLDLCAMVSSGCKGESAAPSFLPPRSAIGTTTSGPDSSAT